MFYFCFDKTGPAAAQHVLILLAAHFNVTYLSIQNILQNPLVHVLQFFFSSFNSFFLTELSKKGLMRRKTICYFTCVFLKKDYLRVRFHQFFMLHKFQTSLQGAVFVNDSFVPPNTIFFVRPLKNLHQRLFFGANLTQAIKIVKELMQSI